MLNKYSKILITSLFVILVSVQAGKSFVLDELDFPVVSHATSQTAKPIYYRGESAPFHVGTYHPTLYINSLAVFIKVFGYSETSIRIYGIICALASAYLLLLILRQLIRKKNPAAEALLLGLFLLNPYTIANTTLPDIDSTILPVLILLFVYYSFRYLLEKKDMSRRVVLILGALFGLALWSKLTTPLVIPPFLVCLGVITSKSWKKSIVVALKVTLLGTAAFVVTYFIYCKLLGLSTTYTYHFLVDSFTKGTSSDGPVIGVINNLKNIRFFIYWLTLPVVALFGVSFVGIMLDKDKSEKARAKKLLITTGLLITLFYIALIAPFGGFFKYPFPTFGTLILSIVLFYDRYLQDTKINLLYAGLVTSLGFILEKIYWGDKMFSNARPFAHLAILLLSIALYCVLLQIHYTRRLAAQMFLLISFFAIGFQLSISRVQATAPYPTKYLYGQMGMDQAADYLRSNTSSDEVIWSMKDIGYYVNNKYIESYGYFFDKSLEKDLINKLQDSKVRYYVVTTGIGQDNIDYYTNIKQILNKYAVREKQYGNYIIYKSKE